MHVGSTVALCPPRVALEDGGEYRPNLAQRWVWDRWLEFWRIVAQYKRDGWRIICVVNGECIDGRHHETSQLASQSPEIQAVAALEALAVPLPLVSEWLVTRGTEAHSGKGAASDYSIARELGARVDTATGTHAAYHWLFDVGGVVFDAAHHTSGGVRPAALELDRMTIDADQGRKVGGIMPDVIIRSHIHKEDEKWRNGRYSVVTPAWALKSAFAHRLTRSRSASVGGLLVEVQRGTFNPRLITFQVPITAPSLL